MSWGSATVSAERQPTLFQGWEVSIQVTARDEVADGKCVYVEYRIRTRDGTDSDSTLATACNQQTVTNSTTRNVGSRGIATPTYVEFKMCKAVWGVDPCTEPREGRVVF